MSDTVTITPQAGGIVKSEFGATTMEARGEMASTVLAAREEAQVRARYQLALMRPRRMAQVRAGLLELCRDPGFASVAIYRKPVGKGVEGLSIRFVEAALPLLTNVHTRAQTVFSDAYREVVLVSVTDLESNTTHEAEIPLERAVERQSADDREVLGERTNSYGKKTYRVVATWDEYLNQRNAAISKAIRNLGLRVVPAELRMEALTVLRATRAGEIRKDPKAAIRKLCDAFLAARVPPAELERYLGHAVETASEEEIEELRGVYAEMQDGATWHAALKTKFEEREAQQQPPPPLEGAPQESGQGLDELLSALAAATTQAEVREVGKRAKAAKLDAAAKERFDAAYTSRMRDVSNGGGK